MAQKHKLNCLNFSFLSTFLLFFQVLSAQSLQTGLADVVARQEKSLKTEAVLVVVNKDTVIFQKDTKLFSAQRGQAPLGYSSQWLTAALVMVLVDEGKISLDDKVSQYIPIFSSYMKNYITIRHCLSHFTGIQAEAPKALRLFEKKKFQSLEEEVAEFAKKPIQNNAGEVFRFNQMGINIAARVLEIVSKKKFEVLAQQKLFRPLGMRQTTFTSLDGSVVNPSAGARSTAADFARFLRMLLNNGTLNGLRILSEQSVQELRTVHTRPDLIKASPEALRTYAYALGAWAPEGEQGKQANVLLAPSFGGTIPVVDFCRGYGFLFLTKELQDDEKLQTYEVVKDVLDGQFASKCR